MDLDGELRMTTLSSIRVLAETDAGTAGLDSADVLGLAGGSLNVFSSIDSLPVSSLNAGDQAYVTSNNRLYISNGSGWYNVALVNLSPTMSLDQSGTIELSSEGAATTVTITASDADNPQAILTYSVESSGDFFKMATLSQDSSVFTITPRTEDSSVALGDDGVASLTFKTTDNINQATEALSFTLSFITTIDSSQHTTFLLKSSDDNFGAYAAKEYKFRDSNNSLLAWDANVGDVHASAFSPYKNNYSLLLDGNGDYLRTGFTTVADLPADYTIECWIYPRALTGNNMIVDTYVAGDAGAYQLYWRSTGSSLAIWSATDGHFLQDPSSSTIAVNNWYHIAITRSGTTARMFIDGALVDTGTHSANMTHGNSLAIGTQLNNLNNYWDGLISNVRIVNGTAVYTSAFTPPTEPLEAIANTSFLGCHLPYLADGSTNDTTLRMHGNSALIPWSPFLKEPYNGSKHGMSLQFNGTNQRVQHDTTTVNPGTGDCTWECWIYPYNDAGSRIIFETQSGMYAWISYNSITLYSPSGLRIDYSRVGEADRQWHHFAATKSGSTYKMWINGKLAGTDTGPADVTGTGISFGCRYGTNSIDNIGAVADFHITKEVKYTTEFTPPTSAVAHSPGKTLMRWADDLKIYDASGTHELHKMSSGGGPQQSTSVRKWSTHSSTQFTGNDAMFLGSEYVSETETGMVLDCLPIGNEDFTIEGWFYWSSHANNRFLYSQSYAIQLYTNSSGYMNLLVNDSNDNTSYIINLTDNLAIGINNWHHVALVRNGSSFVVYVNGQSYLAGTSSGALPEVRTAAFGTFGFGASQQGGSANFVGYMQDLRISKGLARYTANFTPPTSEFLQ